MSEQHAGQSPAAADEPESVSTPTRQEPGSAPTPPSQDRWSVPQQSPREQRQAKDVATLPPLPVLQQHEAVSPRTGAPARPPLVLVAHILLQLAAAGVAVTYGWHFYRAVTPETYPGSAHVVAWLEPPPGEWLSLTLEGGIAALAALVGGACGVAGFQAWNGWRWSRWAAVAAVLLTGALTALVSWVGMAALVPAVAGAVPLFLPPVTDFFARFARHRAKRPEPYRRPETIFYGRLPRFR